MALDYVSGSGLFDILGKYFHAFETLETVRKTTVKTEVNDAVLKFKTKTSTTLDFDRAVQAAANAEAAWRSSGDSLASALRSDCRGLVQEFVRADNDNVPVTLTEALEYLIAQMIADEFYVEPNVVSVTPTKSFASSATDTSVFATDVGKLGRQLDNTIPENVQMIVTEGGANASFRVRGERAPRSKLSEEFPDFGSGISKTMQPITVGESLLLNPDFEDETHADIPDNWIIEVGTVGTTVTVTAVEVQTITVTGTPTTGTYHVKYTDPITSLVHSTKPIAYNSSASTLQAALRELPGLSDVTVTATGTAPNYTHTITFNGVSGDLALVSVVEHTDSGTYTPAQVSSGETGAVTGKGLKFHNHASQMQAIYQAVTLQIDTVYVIGYAFRCPTTATSGTLQVALFDSIAGTILQDREGNDIKQDTPLSGAGTSLNLKAFFAAVGPSVKQPVYLGIRKSIAEQSADIVIDNVIVAEPQRLYSGGPYVAIFNGQKPVEKDDEWNITVSNNRASDFQKYFDQFFDMSGKDLLLPTSGTTMINDSLIA